MTYPPQGPGAWQQGPTGPYSAPQGGFPQSGGMPQQGMPPGMGQPGPGQPGQPGMGQPGMGQPGMPPGGGDNPYGQPKKSRTGLFVGIAAGVVVLLGGVAIACFILSRDETIAVGDCVGSETAPNAPIYKTRCGSEDSSYKVLGVLDREISQHETAVVGTNACPADWYSAQDGKTYCFSLEFEVGDCLSEFKEDTPPIKMSCQASGADSRVTLRREVTDKTACGEGEGWYVSEKPPRTICFGNT